jgi:acyl dehydratase
MSGGIVDVREINVGDQLPPLSVPITTSLIVAGALASRDYQDVHHDPDLARARGARDVFMNILTTNGFVGRFVTDWAGPGSVLQRVQLSLGVPNYPGDTMRMTGEVTSVDPDRGQVEVRVRGANDLGDHVTATVTLAMPKGTG